METELRSLKHMSLTPTVLLDSFCCGPFGKSWRFSGYVGTLETAAVGEVPSVLADVEKAAARGLYAVGYVAYEAAPGVNPDLPAHAACSDLPLAWFALFRFRRSCIPGEGLPEEDAGKVELVPQVEQQEYSRALQSIKDFIAAGDCYQVNYTLPLAGQSHHDPLALYREMCRGQQAPYCAYLDIGRFKILSASPELFFSVGQGVVTTCPMKGTAKRGRWHDEDRMLAEQLKESAKEQAENLMIVDLLRNDVGVVAETGSVRVDSLFDIETYPTVHQMTSTVSAKLRQGTGLTDIFSALFPCGSVTGAPKRRSMEIISHLEKRPRGVYCGAVGVVAPGGEAVFSVAIRSLVLDQVTKELTMGVGSGVTWGSDVDSEYDECIGKAAFLRRHANDFHLIETIRREDGIYYLLERHLDRLSYSAACFGFTCSIDRIRSELAHHVPSAAGLHKVRLVLAPDGSLDITSEPLIQDKPHEQLRVSFASRPVDSGDLFRFHKTTKREMLDHERACHSDCEEVLFLNQRGEVTEGSYHTIVACIGGRLVTPRLACGVLPGVLRAELLERGEIEEQVLSQGDLEQADELWLINSVRGWRKAALHKSH